jgi:hypothetical protein
MTGKHEKAQGKSGPRISTIWALLFSLVIVILVLATPLTNRLGAQLGSWLIIVDLALISAAFEAALLLVGRRVGTYGERKLRTASGLMVAGLVLTAVGSFTIFVIVVQLPVEAQITPFFLSIGLSLVGLVFMCAGGAITIYSEARRQFAIPSEVLVAMKQVEPDKSFETKGYFVFKKKGIYILLRKEFLGAHFVRLFEETPVSDNKISLPFIGRENIETIASKGEINGLSIAEVRGRFTIPIGVEKRGRNMEVKCAEGHGILNYVFRYDMKGKMPQSEMSILGGLKKLRWYLNLDLSEKFNKPTILRIIDQLKGA